MGEADPLQLRQPGEWRQVDPAPAGRQVQQAERRQAGHGPDVREAAVVAQVEPGQPVQRADGIEVGGCAARPHGQGGELREPGDGRQVAGPLDAREPQRREVREGGERREVEDVDAEPQVQGGQMAEPAQWREVGGAHAVPDLEGGQCRQVGQRREPREVGASRQPQRPQAPRPGQEPHVGRQTVVEQAQAQVERAHIGYLRHEGRPVHGSPAGHEHGEIAARRKRRQQLDVVAWAADGQAPSPPLEGLGESPSPLRGVGQDARQLSLAAVHLHGELRALQLEPQLPAPPVGDRHVGMVVNMDPVTRLGDDLPPLALCPVDDHPLRAGAARRGSAPGDHGKQSQQQAFHDAHPLESHGSIRRADPRRAPSHDS